MTITEQLGLDAFGSQEETNVIEGGSGYTRRTFKNITVKGTFSKVSEAKDALEAVVQYGVPKEQMNREKKTLEVELYPPERISIDTRGVVLKSVDIEKIMKREGAKKVETHINYRQEVK